MSCRSSLLLALFVLDVDHGQGQTSCIWPSTNPQYGVESPSGCTICSQADSCAGCDGTGCAFYTQPFFGCIASFSPFSWCTAPAPGAAASGQDDPHMFGFEGDRFDFKGRNNTVYNVFSARHLAINVLFLHDMFHMGGACKTCSTKTVYGSFMKEIFFNLTSVTNTSITVHFDAMAPSTARVTSVLPGADAEQSTGELKVSPVIPGAKELTIDNVLIRLQRVHTREVRLVVSDGNFEAVAKSRMYPFADQNQKKKRIDFAIASITGESGAVAPHGLVGQTFDKDSIAVDGALDDYTGTLVSGTNLIGHRVVTTQAMGEGAIEGVPAQYEIPRSSPFSTSFIFSRFDSLVAAPRNITALSGKKRTIVKVKGVPAKASMEHDVSEATDGS